MTTPLTPSRLILERVHISSLTVSPDGSQFAYVRTQANKATLKPESQIWLADIDGTNRRQITFVGTANANPTWSPDGTELAFTSVREGNTPNVIAILPITTGGEARVLTQSLFPALSLAWSPDGTTIAYPKPVDPENPDETPLDPKAPAKVRVVREYDYKLDGIGYRGETRNQLFTIDVATGERRQLTSGLNDYMTPEWAPDSTKIATSRWEGNPLDAHPAIIDAATGEVTVLGESGFFSGPPHWSPDGSKIVADLGLYTYTVTDLETNTTRIISPDLGFTPDGVYNPGGRPIWIDDEEILVQGQIGAGFGLFTVDLETGETVEVTRWDLVNEGLSALPDGSAFLQISEGPDGFTGVVRVDRGTGERTVLFEENVALFTESPLASWEIVRVDNDGVTVEGILLKPADFDPRKKYPVILDIHGGPQGAHTLSVNQIAYGYAAAGFIVLLPNPRGSTGYGKVYLDGVNEEWGAGDWTDLNALLDEVLTRPYADAHRTGVSGYSYGGYMTSWAIGQTNRFKAAVCGAPVFDLESFFGTSDIGHIFGPMMWGGTPWEKKEWLEQHSPSNFVHNATTPTFIICGENDDRCPIGQSEQLFVSLMKLGVDTEFARYPGGSHAFIVRGEIAHQIDALERSIAWLKTYLGDPA